MNTMLQSLPANWSKKIFRLISALAILSQSATFGQAAVYNNEGFNANIPGYPTWTAGAGFKTPTMDWTQSIITGGGTAPNNYQWVNAGANPASANQNIAGMNAGAGFIRYMNRTVAYPAISGAPNGDAAFIATRSLDWSGHTTYNATTDTFGISVFRDGTAGALLTVLDYIEVYVNNIPSLTGAVLASTTGGINRIHRSNTQTPAATAGWNRYQFVIPNDVRFYGAGGGTSSAYIIIAGYSAGGNNIFIDNINMPQWQTQMVVTAANVLTTLNANVGKNSTDNVMLGVQITTKGSLTPRRLDGILFNVQGSSAFTIDVTQPNGAKCWFTGGANTFATAGGSVSVPKVNPTSPSYTNAQLFFGYLDGVAGCPTALTTAAYNFFPGNENFVWLAYDVPATAQTGNYIGGGFEQLFTGRSAPGSAGCFGDTVITSCGIQTPVNFAAFTPCPSVSAIRQIVDQAYNIPTYTSGTSRPGGGYYNNDFISGVYFPGDNNTKIDNYLHNNVCGLCVGVGGQNCQRFSCHPPDYTLFDPINMGAYMERVVQVTQGKGVRTGTPPYAVKAQCGTWFSSNTVAIFIDWNKDGDFDDRYSGTGGFIYENYGSQQQAQASMSLPATWGANTSWTISVPTPADVVVDLNDANQLPNNSNGPVIVGNVRMRVREIFAAPNNYPFNGNAFTGVHPTTSGQAYGEVEDYTIQVLADCPMPGSNVCKWVGGTNDWNNPGNWCPALPTKNDIAFIAPGPLFAPTILDNTNAECRTLQIMPGAKLEINAASGSSLKVYDDVIIGQGATLGTGSGIAVTSELNKTMTIPGKTQVPPLGLALSTVTPFRTNAQAKTQIAYTAAELATTYGWKAGDVIESISIEVNSISGGAGPSTYQGLRIVAYLTTAPVTYTFPAPAYTKMAVMPGDANVVAGWPKVIYGPGSTTLNMPNATGGTQTNGNYATFNLAPGTLIWDGVSSLVLSFENWTSSGLAPAKSYVLYDEAGPSFSTLVLNYSVINSLITGQSICGSGAYYNASNVTTVAAGITATVSTQRPRLDFKLFRTNKQFPITVGGDWINNNLNTRTTTFNTTPVYNIPGDSGFIAGNSRVIFDPTGRNTVNSPGLNTANSYYYAGVPGATLPADVDQEISSAVTSSGNSTVFGTLEIKKTSTTAKVVKQAATFNPFLTGHYADTLVLNNGELSLNRKIFTLQQPGAAALTRTSGWLGSEDFAGATPGNIQSKFVWNIDSGTTGIYSVPFKAANTSIFNFKYNKTIAADNVGSLTLGTYGTPSTNNTPYPNSLLTVPPAVLSMTTNAPVVDATPWTIDRFWLVGRSTTTALSGTMTFEYDNSIEGTLTSAYTANEMKAQRYEILNATIGWAAPFPGQADAIVSGNIRAVTHPAAYIDQNFTVWTIVHTNATQAPLGGIACAINPVITANGPTTFCGGGSVTLSSNSSTGNLWSTGATTQSISVTATGTFTVTVTNNAGCSASASINTIKKPKPNFTVTPTAAILCPPVTNVGISVSGNAASYFWSPATGLNVTTGTTVTASPLTTTTYKVTGTSAAGCSSTKTINVTVKPKPVNTATINITATSALATWDSVSCAINYTIQYKPVGGTWLTVTTGSSNISKALTGLTPSTNYAWRVKAKYPNNTFSSYTAVTNFTTPAFRLGESATEKSLVVYPNPASDLLNLEFPFTEGISTKITVVNTIGQTVLEQNVSDDLSTTQLNIQSLTHGLYVVTVINGDNTYTARFIKE